jgi:hypothetical protein
MAAVSRTCKVYRVAAREVRNNLEATVCSVTAKL